MLKIRDKTGQVIGVLADEDTEPQMLSKLKTIVEELFEEEKENQECDTKTSKDTN
jgi:hypothetical protein